MRFRSPKRGYSKAQKNQKHIEFMGNPSNIEYKIEKVKCECGSEVRKGDISTHKKTKKTY